MWRKRKGLDEVDVVEFVGINVGNGMNIEELEYKDVWTELAEEGEVDQGPLDEDVDDEVVPTSVKRYRLFFRCRRRRQID